MNDYPEASEYPVCIVCGNRADTCTRCGACPVHCPCHGRNTESAYQKHHANVTKAVMDCLSNPRFNREPEYHAAKAREYDRLFRGSNN